MGVGTCEELPERCGEFVRCLFGLVVAGVDSLGKRQTAARQSPGLWLHFPPVSC
jgi:hypothetical protein